MQRVFASAILMMTAFVLPWQARAESTGITEPVIDARLAKISELYGLNAPLRLEVLQNDTEREGMISQGRLGLSRRLIAAINTGPELDALLATFIVFDRRVDPRPIADDAVTQSVGGWLAAGAVAVAAGQFDPPNRKFRSGPGYNINGVGFSGPSKEKSELTPDMVRGQRILALITGAGSCSGAAVGILTRIKSGKDQVGASAAHASTSIIARRALAGFGTSIYPPDYSCVKKRD